MGYVIMSACNDSVRINFSYCEKKFTEHFIYLNDQNQALNIFGQSEEFQRELYKAIQIIKNINNN